MTDIKKMKDTKITAIIDGEEVECDVLFQYTAEGLNEVFVGYTDNGTDEEGKTNLFVSKFNPLVPNVLMEITDPEEMKLVDDIIKQILEENN